MTAAFDPALPAAILAQAWRTGMLLVDLPPPTKPTTLAQGYDAQDRLLAASGARRAGWKLGVGSPAAMRAGRLARALVGQLDATRIHASGTHISLPSRDPVTVECEIAFVLDRDIPPAPGRQLAAEDVRHMCVSFELVRSRFIDRRAVGWPAFAADNVGFEALVVSPAVAPGLDRELLAAINDSASVAVNGKEKARALSGDGATDPIAAMNALFAHAAERGVTLRAGEIVSTGAMCQPFDLAGPGHEVVATFLGQSLAFKL